MPNKRLYDIGTQIVFPKAPPAVIARKDGRCRWCGEVMRKSILSQHVPECRDKHQRVRETKAS